MFFRNEDTFNDILQGMRTYDTSAMFLKERGHTVFSDVLKG
jgi:hypothetical protein